MKKWTPKEVEQQLGLQYAQLLQKQDGSMTQGGMHQISKECDEIIQGSLQLLERYNKINIALRSKQTAAAGVFS